MSANKPLAMAVSAAVAAWALSAQAQNPNQAQPQNNAVKEEVIVTASPLNKKPGEVSQSISVLSGAELRQQAAANLGQTLNDVPGVSASSFGPGAAAPVIRGQSGNRVRILQDNIGTGDIAALSADHAITSEPLLAERIEVLRGPATLRYGGGAIGGVVNVLDNRIPDQPIDGLQGAAELRYNTVNEGTTGVGLLEGGGQGWAWHLDAIWRETDDTEIPGYAEHLHDEPPEPDAANGFIPNSDGETQVGTLGVSRIWSTGFAGISVQQLDNDYGIPPGGHEHGHHEEEHEEEHHEEHEHGHSDIRLEMEQTRIDLKGEQRQLAGDDALTWRLGYTDYEHVEMEGAEVGTRFSNEVLEGRVEYRHQPWGEWRGAFGVQALTREFEAVGEEAYVPRSDIQGSGLFYVGEQEFAHWHLELGARLEWQEIDPDGMASVDHTPISLSAAALWHFNDNDNMALIVSRSQRAPAVEELFADGAHAATQTYDQGNTNLDVETGNNLELNYRYQGRVGLTASVYYNQIEDYIYLRNTGLEEDELPVYAWSQEDASFTGAEAELSVPFADHWTLSLFGDVVNGELDNGGDVPRLPPRRAGIALGWAASGWNAELRFTDAAEQDSPGENEEATEGWQKLDARVGYQGQFGSSEYLLFLRGNNLTDEEIRLSTSYLREAAPEPGRGFTLGARLSF